MLYLLGVIFQERVRNKRDRVEIGELDFNLLVFNRGKVWFDYFEDDDES